MLHINFTAIAHVISVLIFITSLWVSRHVGCRTDIIVCRPIHMVFHDRDIKEEVLGVITLKERMRGRYVQFI